MAIKEPRIISMWEHKDWGDNIFFTDFKERKVAGFMKQIPREGDILRSEMESGKIGRFEVKNVHVSADPGDQFFATVSDLEYED